MRLLLTSAARSYSCVLSHQVPRIRPSVGAFCPFSNAFVRVRQPPQFKRRAATLSGKLLKSSFPAFKITSRTPHQKQLEVQHVTPSELLESPDLSHPKINVTKVDKRDVIALGVTDHGHLEDAYSPPCILVRKGCLVVSLGSLRAVVRHDVAFILGAEDTKVKPLGGSISEKLHGTDPEAAKLEDPEPFELRFLEAGLEEVCNDIEERVEILTSVCGKIVRNIQLAHPNDVIDCIVHCQPLLEQLGKLQAEVRQLDQCIVDVLRSDSDMTAMLLTAIAYNRAVDPDSEDHDEVEVILEHFHRSLRKALLQVDTLSTKIQFGIGLSDVKLAAYRSKLDELQVHVSLLGVCFGICAAVAGFFGMNVPVPLGEDQQAFYLIVAGCLTVGMVVYGRIWYTTVGVSLSRSQALRMEKVVASQRVLRDVTKIHHTLRQAALTSVGLHAGKGIGYLDDVTITQLLKDALARPVSGLEVSCVKEFVEFRNPRDDSRDHH